ncbi:MAG: hypothetical protein JKY67_17455, partial [Pseudomonadales bacterium]|nr:hypothetical protein [Pseudomonadales bacterium]
KQVLLSVDGEMTAQQQGQPEFAEQLQQMLEPYRNGHCRVCIQYDIQEVGARLYLGEEWRVTPKEELLNHLRLRFGKDAVRVTYS